MAATEIHDPIDRLLAGNPQRRKNHLKPRLSYNLIIIEFDAGLHHMVFGMNGGGDLTIPVICPSGRYLIESHEILAYEKDSSSH